MNENRLKILFSMPNPSLQGGPAQHLPLLLDGLRDHYDIWLFEFGRKKDTEKLWQKLRGRLLDLFRLNLAISAFEPDVIHHNTAFDRRSIIRDAPLAWLASFRQVPILIKVHGSHQEAFGDMGLVVNQLRDYLVRNAWRICVLSEMEKNEFEGRWPHCLGRVTVAKNIIKSEFFEVQRRESPNPTVLFISRFIRNKGIYDLLDAVPLVLGKIPDARFIFIGSGPDGEEFDRAIKDRKLDQAVTHLPQVGNQETRDYYRKSWCLAFPTHYPEGMPMVVAEAMAAGCPVITSRTRFSGSLMTEGRHCLFIDPDRPGSIAAQIIRLLNDRGLREDLGRNSKELAKQFTDQEVTEEFRRIYGGLADKSILQSEK